MRYLESENPYIWSRFTTGDTVTITIYKASDDSVIVNAAAMSELASTGYFKYQFNPSPSSLTEYFYITTNGIEEHAGKIILGGYPNDQALASVCTETRLAQLDEANMPSDIDNVWLASSTTFTRLTAARAGYLDNLSSGAVALESTAQSINDEIGGKWEITGNQMIFYKSDNSTETMRFNLFDADGNPAVDNVYKRERVP